VTFKRGDCIQRLAFSGVIPGVDGTQVAGLDRSALSGSGVSRCRASWLRVRGESQCGFPACNRNYDTAHALSCAHFSRGCKTGSARRIDLEDGFGSPQRGGPGIEVG
jgi:hypothetical protein